MRKTKIVATLGPATYDPDAMEAIIRAGADALRFNFSHGTRDQHSEAYHTARGLSQKLGKAVTLIQDLQGPKIRVGRLEGEQAVLHRGSEVELTPEDIVGNESSIPVAYDSLEADVKPGEMVLIDDGKIRLKCVRVDDRGVTCRVVEGGTLTPHKGVNLPETDLSTPAVTPKDIDDLRFGLQTGFDVIALSFVAQASDVELLRKEMRKMGKERPVVSKLERSACLDNLDEILEASDAVMVARGDLGVEVPIERLPILQKTIIRKANHRGIPVITATQMLESMTRGLLPTRAEAADVANAVFDGTDALMLSGETAVGQHPVQAVKMMNNIAVQAENFQETYSAEHWKIKELRGDEIAKAVCHSAVVAAQDLGLGNIVAVTVSGQTALDIAALRPDAPIHAFVSDPFLQKFLILSRGVTPHLCDLAPDFEALMRQIDAVLIEKKIAGIGQSVALVMGLPITDHKATNSLIVRTVGSETTEPVPA
jgi:pyruvate kinase